jgi:hypothetical protein
VKRITKKEELRILNKFINSIHGENKFICHQVMLNIIAIDYDGLDDLRKKYKNIYMENKKMKDNEKIVRDLVNTFNDRNELPIASKGKMKQILFQFTDSFIVALNNDKLDTQLSIWEFIDQFVEERFKPQEE